MYEKFNGSLGEFCELYFSGKVFYQTDSGHGYELCQDVLSSRLLDYYNSGIYTKSEPKWYENLGEGVLCWVWDECWGLKSLEMIGRYLPDMPYSYVDDEGDTWKYAEPLTEEEVMKHIWKGGL